MIIVHADDFAISKHISKQIIECCKQSGKIKSISVIPNMKCFEECIHLLVEANIDASMSVHLNFMEGHCCAKKEDVEKLVDEHGYFKVSWGDLLVASYKPKAIRKKYRDQLAIEIKAQIEHMLCYVPKDYVLRIDSHQHTHPIPVVTDALCKVIEENNYKIEYVRVPGEPVLPYIKAVSLWHTYHPINMIKNIILNYYCIQLRKKMDHFSVSHCLVWGILMGGEMDVKRVEKLLPSMKAYADNKKTDLQLIFHPGVMEENEITEEYMKKGFLKYHLSSKRDVEYESILKITSDGMI